MIGRVLVVDDDDNVRRSLEASLARGRFEVVTAKTGEHAIELADQNFDIVISDYNMNTALSGADVVSHYKQQFGDRVFCVVLSGEDDDATRTKCFDAGADAVLMKPILPSELRRRLGSAVMALRSLAA